MHAALLIALSLVAAEPRPAKAPRVERPKSGAPNWGGILEAPRSHDRPITGTVSRMGLEQPAQPPADVERGGWAEEEANGRVNLPGKQARPAPRQPPRTPNWVTQYNKQQQADEVRRYRAERARNRYGRQPAMSTHNAYQNAAMRAVRQVQGW